ncbi:DMT family transporter [Paenibacillus profundus]|uniref:DMT family transporter n=1 Tax=Paenibacillus profundus TaxID=1173085 RepID=A0ABS8YEP0_9BACL|nr:MULTISPECIES: DMT family transporter [Paenibacillus]MCE5170116.1 DMT family transporter [Paenibacillus profundus]MCM3338993.1 DMT family transporter [Paenibacillus sp. MER TA 81-3]
MKAQQWFTHPVGMTVSAVLATLLWGSAMPAIKIGYEELGIASQATHEQWVFAGYRFLLAGFMLMLFAACVNRAARLGNPTIRPKPRRTGWRVARLAVIQTFLQYLCFYIGLSLSTGMKGAIITGATCFFQMVVARLMDGNESFTPGKTLGLCLGFAGVIIVTLNQGGMAMSLGIGDVCLILSALFGGWGNVLARHEARDFPVLWLTGRQMALGGFGLIVIGAWRAGWAPFHWDTASVMLLLYLAFLSAAGFSLWNMVMKYNSVGKVSMFLFLIPVFGVLLSAWLLGEAWNEWTLAALGLVVAGILVVNRSAVAKQREVTIHQADKAC